jgi:ataxia telangiectasia mutated family protein
MECSSRFSEWVPQISILISDTLASEDLVFGQLSTVLASDVDFAEEVLPILIHTILQRERQQAGLVKPIRKALSKYFTKVLSSSLIDNRCIRSIVEIVLHLRNILPASQMLLHTTSGWKSISPFWLEAPYCVVHTLQHYYS